MATAMGVQHLSLDSSTLASCSSFRPALSTTQNGSVKVGGGRRMIKCSCSKQEESAQKFSRNALSRLVATGLALTISTSSGIALAGAEPGLVNVVNVGKQAEKLLKDADKLTNDDSPPRFGPSRGGIPDEDASRIAQKGGSGAIPELQNSGSELVGQARDQISDKVETTKQKLDETVGKGQDKTEEVKKGIQGFFGQAKDKVTSDVDTVKEGSTDPSDKVKGFVGDASGKIKSDVDGASDNASGVVGSIKKGLRIQ